MSDFPGKKDEEMLCYAGRFNIIVGDCVAAHSFNKLRLLREYESVTRNVLIPY